MKNDHGFSATTVILLLVVIGVIGAIGYKLVQADASNAQNQTIKPAKTQKADAPTEQTKTKAVELKEYKNTEFGFSFQYPATWKYEADFSFVERGANEGEVSVTSPSGAVIEFKANMGGKGGGCGDPNPSDTPHNTAVCNTEEILKIMPVQATTSTGYPVNLYHYKFTTAGENAQSEYGMYVDSGQYAMTTTGATIGAIFPFGMMQNFKGNIESHTSGGDRTSLKYFDSQQAKDTEQVLKTFRLL